MTDEILKEIYKMKQSSKYLTEEEAIAKYKEEYTGVCEGTEKLYNIIWKYILEKAFLNNEKFIYVGIGHSGPLSDLYEDLYNFYYYKKYFELDKNMAKNIYWFSLDEDCQDKIFFIVEDIKEKLESDGFTHVDLSRLDGIGGIRCVMSREKLNEFIVLAEKKYKPEETLRRNLQKE